MRLDTVRLTKRPLDNVDRQSIREQLADGLPRETIAADLKVSLKQVDAIRAHVTMAEQRKAVTDAEMRRRAYRYARARSRARSMLCVTLADCNELWAAQGGCCALSGHVFSDHQVTTNAKILSRPWRPSLDRIDSHKGYEKANVRLVAQIVNFGLGEWPIQVFIEMCRLVSSNHPAAHKSASRLGRAVQRQAHP